jgi:hypothetical protein
MESQSLGDRIARLGDYEAKWVLAQVDDYLGTAYPPLTEETRAFMRRALASFVPGRPLNTRELEQEFGLSKEQRGMLVYLLDEAVRYPPLTEAQIAAIKRGLADIEAGRTFSHEEVMRHFGIND